MNPTDELHRRKMSFNENARGTHNYHYHIKG